MPLDALRLATVASARGRRGDDPALDPNWIYVGRPIVYRGWAGSVWSNPFWNGRNGFGFDRGRVRRDWLATNADLGPSPIEHFARWLEEQPRLLARLPELAGRVLVCWCGAWAPGDPAIGCHAQILAERINGLMDTSREGEPPCLL